MNDETMKLGLLMESVQAQQKLVEENLASLKAHARDLDGIVRDEIRRTLVEELEGLAAESRRAASALQAMGRAASLRTAIWSFALSALCTVIPGAVLWWNLPSEPQVAALRAQRDELTAGIARLQAAGGGVSWRRCGAAQRLCVRVDRTAPAFGEQADFVIVKGN
jgi:hypothetical protein